LQKWRKVAETRFGQLSPGQYFTWQGRRWQKTSPLIARENGADEPQMVPRSTIVTPDDADQLSADTRQDTIEPDSLLQVLQKIQRESLDQIELLQLEPDQTLAIRKILDRAISNALTKTQ
jgi:hypothetical protein